MKSKNYWASKRDDGWAVKREGADKASALFETQAEAWSDARRRARGTQGEAFLKNREGKIRSRNTYGNDPFPPKG